MYYMPLHFQRGNYCQNSVYLYLIFFMVFISLYYMSPVSGCKGVFYFNSKLFIILCATYFQVSCCVLQFSDRPCQLLIATAADRHSCYNSGRH